MTSRFRYSHKEMTDWYLYMDISWMENGKLWEPPDTLTFNHPTGMKIEFSGPVKVGEEAWEDEDDEGNPTGVS